MPFSAARARIEELKKEYDGVTINGPKDRDGHKVVKNAWRHIRTIRLDAEKLHKQLSGPALTYKQACDAGLRMVKEELSDMEERFYKDWKRYEGDRAEARREKERLEAIRVAEENAAIAAENERKERELAEREAAIAKAVLENRVNQMLAIGLSQEEVKAMSDIVLYDIPQWEEEVENAKAKVAERKLIEEEAAKAASEAAEKAAAAAEVERAAKEEAAKLKAVQDEQERAAKAKAAAESAEAERIKQAGDRGLLLSLGDNLAGDILTMDTAEPESDMAKAAIAKALKLVREAAVTLSEAGLGI